MYSQSVTILAGQLDMIWNINNVSVLILIKYTSVRLWDYEDIDKENYWPIACFCMYQVQVHGTLWTLSSTSDIPHFTIAANLWCQQFPKGLLF